MMKLHILELTYRLSKIRYSFPNCAFVLFRNLLHDIFQIHFEYSLLSFFGEKLPSAAAGFRLAADNGV